ncbi:hypothetical protein Hanom_Chr15g01412001 [Helianthus anomalus]
MMAGGSYGAQKVGLILYIVFKTWPVGDSDWLSELEREKMENRELQEKRDEVLCIFLSNEKEMFFSLSEYSKWLITSNVNKNVLFIIFYVYLF